MILKIPCALLEETVIVLIRRDAINLVTPIEDGSQCNIYITGVSDPVRAKVRFSLMAEFLGKFFVEGSRDINKANSATKDLVEGNVSPDGKRAGENKIDETATYSAQLFAKDLFPTIKDL